MATVSAVACVLALIGWAASLHSLTTVLPGGVPMNPATAVVAILTAVSLALQVGPATPAARRLGRWIASGVALAGLLALARHLFGWDTGFDALLFRDRLAGNRMAPNTALVLLLLGSSLALLDLPVRLPVPPAPLLALGGLAVSGFGLVGYTFGAKPLYGVTSHVPMAANTAAALAALSVGVILARPDRGLAALLLSGGAGGALARRLIPAAVGVPWGLGLLRLRGEQAGLYDTEIGVALMAVATIGLFLAMVWVTASSLDRTDARRREAEAALRASAAAAHDLYDLAPCGYHSVGPDGTLAAVNQTELRWLGYAAGEVVGRVRFADLVSPASRPTYEAAFARLRADGEVSDVELDLVRRDGTTFPVLVSSTAARGPDGSYLRSRTTLTDLTGRKLAEAEVVRMNAELEDRVRARTGELRATEELFRGAFEHTNVAMVLTDLDNRFLRANAAFARLFGYTPAEVQGLGLADITHPDHLGDSLDRRAELLGGAGDCFQMEKRYRHRDGHVLWGLTNVALVRGPDGKPQVYVGQVQDITEQKAAGESVRSRTAELEAANRELAQRNAENAMFVYSVSHDLRSPLVNLQGFSKELGKGCDALATLLQDEGVPVAVRDAGVALLGGKMGKSLGFIQSAVLRLSGIIDALLRLSRAGRVEYRWERVDVGQVVARVVAASQGTVAERAAAVRVGELPPARGDRTAVEQVFGNLVGNALTYLNPARPGEIEVGCLPPDPAAAASGFHTYFVRDNGLGIAAEHREKVFQVFQRVHPGVGTGEGMGLSIVARVAERHGGRAWVESRVGAGSTFFVSLPAAAAGLH